MSLSEREDFHKCREFRISEKKSGRKSFFRSKEGVLNFIKKSVKRQVYPPYVVLYNIEIDDFCLMVINYEERISDGHETIVFPESQLKFFNQCVSMVIENDVESII